MIRFALRSIGLVILAAAFVAFLYDGTRTIADGQLSITATQDIWSYLHPESLNNAEARMRRDAPPWVWDPGIATVLTAPAALVLGILGALLILLGRPRRPRIGYARR